MAGSVLGTLLLNIVTHSDTSGLNKTDRALRRTQSSIKTMSKDMGFLSKFAKGFLGYFSFRQISNAMSGYLQLEKDIGAMKSRFFAVTGDERQAADEFEWIRGVATRTANDIKATADSYSIFYSAVRKNMGEEATREVFEGWTRVGRVLHLSEYQMERVTYALREMASKGAIYSQDLRMQIGTHVPNAMGLAEKAAAEMGFTGVGWFEKLQKAAKGNSKLTAEFVRRFSQQATKMYGSEEAFKKAMQQPDALAKSIANMGQNFLIDFSKAGGSAMTITILKSILSLLEGVDLKGLATSWGNWAKKFGNFMAIIISHLGMAVKLLELLAVGSIAGRVSARVKGAVGMLTLGKAVASRQASMFTLRSLLMGSRGWLGTLIATGFLGGGRKLLGGLIRSALGFFGGPWGALITVLITFAPQIIDICKKIWAKISGQKMNLSWRDRFGDKTGEHTKDVLLDIQKRGVLSQQDLETQLINRGESNLLGAVTYVDNKHVTFTFNDTTVRPEDIPKIYDQTTAIDKNALAGNKFNRGTGNFRDMGNLRSLNF